MSTRRDKLSKILRIRDKTTSQRKIKKQKNSSTPPPKSKMPETKGNKKMI